MTDPELELRRNIVSGNLDRYSRIQMAVLAKEMGLDPSEYAAQFPGNRSEKNFTFNNYGNAVGDLAATQPGMPVPVAKPVIRKGLSPLAAIGIGLLGAAVPGAGIIGFLLNKAPAVVQQVEKVVEKPVEKVIELPGKSYGVDVDVEVIPPPDK